MAINKDKVRAAAQKYLQKGQIDKAIREFQRLVDEAPSDVRTLLKIGDLYARKGDAEAATQTYTRVARFYADQGFFLKAVAVYKQIIKLNPTAVPINIKLAELYSALGLLPDAISQYRQIAALYEEQSDDEGMAEMLAKMVELDPDNIATRIKIAELTMRQGSVEDAALHFRHAAGILKAQNRTEDYIKVAERILRVAPSDLGLVRELAGLYMQRGDAKRALAKLQISFKEDPYDLATLGLMAKAFVALEQLSKAVSVYREIARIHGEAGDERAREKALHEIVILAPKDTEAHVALGKEADQTPPPRPTPLTRGQDGASAASKNVLSRIEVARKQVTVPLDVHEVQRGPKNRRDEDLERVAIRTGEYALLEPASTMGEAPHAEVEERPRAEATSPDIEETDPIEKQLVEVDIYVKYGLWDKARQHLEELLKEAPQHRDILDRYAELLEQAGEDRRAAQIRVRMAHGAAVAKDPRARDDLKKALALDPASDSAKALLGQLESGAEIDSLPYSRDDDTGRDDEDDDDDLSGIDIDIDFADDSDAAVDVTPGVVLEEAPDPIPDLEAGAESVAVEVEVDFAQPGATDPVAEVDPGAGGMLGDGEDEHALMSDILIEDIAVQAPLFDDPDLADSSDADVNVEVEVDVPSPRAVEARGSSSLPDDIDSLISGAIPTRPSRVGPSSELPTPVVPDVADEVPAGGSEASVPDLSAELDELAFYVQQGIVDEALGLVEGLLQQHPRHPALLARRQELLSGVESLSGPGVPEAEPEPEISIESVEIAENLAEEIADLDFEESVEFSLGEMLDEFKRGVAAQVDDQDYDTHYNLGIAYKEMNLLDDAVREFEIAMGSSTREIGALTMMGLCELARGDSSKALTYFSRGLNSEYVTTDAAVALRYEIALAYEAQNKIVEAARFYAKAHSIDPTFRDVAARLEKAHQSIGGHGNEGSHDLDELLQDTSAEQEQRKQNITYV